MQQTMMPVHFGAHINKTQYFVALEPVSCSIVRLRAGNIPNLKKNKPQKMTKTITPSFELVYLLIAVLIYVLLPKTVLNATAAVVITAVAAFITYWIKFNLRPRNMIDIGDDKAVLITGNKSS